MTDQKDEKKLYLSNKLITCLFIYYVCALIIGMILAVLALLPEIISNEKFNILGLALLGAGGMSLNGAAIFYIRKLYKLCFSTNLVLNDPENQYIRKLGTVMYFICRPLYSIGFSVLVVIGLHSGLMFTGGNSLSLNEGLVRMSMFISFFVGFLSGQFIGLLEKIGEKIIHSATR